MIALVTGGCGFIGSQIVKELQTIATEIRILDDMSLGKLENINGLKYKLTIGCITDKEIVKEIMNNVTHVFHCAALISVADSTYHPKEYEQINTIGTINLLEESVKNNIQSFVFSSSCSVYGDDDIILRNEKSNLNPVSPYAWTKIHGENYCKFFHEHHGLNTVCLRYFNVYGSKQDPNKNYAAAVPLFIKKGLNNDSIHIYGDGQQSRDFVHVEDIARANIHVALKKLIGIYNIGSGDSVSIIDLSNKILLLTNNNKNIIFDKARPGDMRYIECDNKKILSTGFKFKYSLDEGLKTVIQKLTK